ncbi:MAG: hypothetical protein KGL37_07165, partial [Acidobacteriota bacterium]|nr:hypothetical protein [Acidobacteriota bacterium]
EHGAWVTRGCVATDADGHEDFIDASNPLSYWWCYRSDRAVDQHNPQRFDINRERDPELVGCVVAAKQRLKAKLHVER